MRVAQLQENNSIGDAVPPAHSFAGMINGELCTKRLIVPLAIQRKNYPEAGALTDLATHELA